MTKTGGGPAGSCQLFTLPSEGQSNIEVFGIKHELTPQMEFTGGFYLREYWKNHLEVNRRQFQEGFVRRLDETSATVKLNHSAKERAFLDKLNQTHFGPGALQDGSCGFHSCVRLHTYAKDQTAVTQ